MSKFIDSIIGHAVGDAIGVPCGSGKKYKQCCGK